MLISLNKSSLRGTLFHIDFLLVSARFARSDPSTHTFHNRWLVHRRCRRDSRFSCRPGGLPHPKVFVRFIFTPCPYLFLNVFNVLNVLNVFWLRSSPSTWSTFGFVMEAIWTTPPDAHDAAHFFSPRSHQPLRQRIPY